eukprot:TRINITY_DN1094_c0_g1_i1.p2 TRINITY_DN1094_c0_g1~~TRINITY_DN1094_c0_g1_i1.p2  ORF type:complete len:147 (+),score=61.52 TRINITY_DN1094_c0_g1_i1:433-873(+)
MVMGLPFQVLSRFVVEFVSDLPAAAQEEACSRLYRLHSIMETARDAASRSMLQQQQLMQQHAQQLQQLSPSIFNAAENATPKPLKQGRRRTSTPDDKIECSVHKTMRSRKHLAAAQGGGYRCIPGHHCLEVVPSAEEAACMDPGRG